MTPIEWPRWGVLAAIAAMALVTYLLRVGGFWLMAHVPPTRRVRRMLEALPGSVVVAVVLPIIVRDGLAAALAIGAAGAVMLLRSSDILAVLTGMAVAAAIRAAGW
jgi:uncharacterized membrane protein